jgi:hypothetical protein
MVPRGAAEESQPRMNAGPLIRANRKAAADERGKRQPQMNAKKQPQANAENDSRR